MKKQSKRLSKRLRNEIDFEYVGELDEQEKRAATFYEYARHCNPLKEFVSELRQAGAFCKDKAETSNLELLGRLNSKSRIWHNYQLYGLAVSNDFPKKPFKDNKAARGIFASKSIYYGIEVMSRIPWPAVIGGWVKNRNTEDALIDLRNWSGTSTLHAIAIPWRYSNEQLGKMFLELLRTLRPENLPEPNNVGRKGSYENLGVLDMLNQLAAYRLQQAGRNFDSDGHIYTTEKGWDKAIGIAKDRIEGMADHPFFGYSSEENSGIKSAVL